VPRVNESLQVALEVIPKTLDAGRRLAGIDHKMTAVTDGGVALQVDTRQLGAPDYYRLPEGGCGEGAVGTGVLARPLRPPQYVQFPPLPAGVHRLARLEGSLRLFSDVRITELKIPADSQGQTLKQGDITLTVKSWRKSTENGGYLVILDAQIPDLPVRDLLDARYAGRCQPSVVLVGRDGREYLGYASLDSYNYGTSAKVQLHCVVTLDTRRWQTPPARPDAGTFEPDHLLVSILRRGDADKTVPFVLENIPVP
jgi:hypothetical protein